MRETENLFIRRFREADLPAVQRILGDPAVMRYSGLPPFSTDQSREWLSGHIPHPSKSDPLGIFALELKGSRAVIGYSGLEPLPADIAGSIEVTVGLEPTHWAKGYAAEAVSSILQYAFDECRLDEVAAVVHAANAAARRLVTKCGFRQVRELAVEGVGPHVLYSLPAPSRRI